LAKGGSAPAPSELTVTYQQALETEPGQKLAGEVTLGQQLGQELDALFDTLEKQATGLGQALNLYGGYAALSGGLAGLLTWAGAHKRQQAQLLEQAQNKRRRQRYEAQPSPFYVHPVLPDEMPEAGDQSEMDLDQLASA
jgi:hypothetical protein